MEHISEPSEAVGEVVFGQPEKRAGATELDGSVLDRRKENEWLQDTEPYHGARPRTTEVDRPVDDVLDATLGGHSATRCPMLDVTFPFILPGWKAEKTSTGYLMISPKMAMDRRRAENEDWFEGRGSPLGLVKILTPRPRGGGDN